MTELGSIVQSSPTLAPPGTRLRHLSGPGAVARQVLAAHYLADCPTVVEIGGAGLPITGFLHHGPKRVIVIDPKIVPFTCDTLDGAPCRVDHVAAKVQGLALDLEGRYGVALLGLSLKPLGSRPAVDASLVTLLAGAHRVVLEHAMRLDRALRQIDPLLEQAGLVTMLQLTMHIEDGVIENDDFAERRLLVLAPARAGRSA